MRKQPESVNRRRYIMQEKGLDFKHKEVINISDGRRLGYVQDVCADLETGNITHIIVPGSGNKLMNFFKTNNTFCGIVIDVGMPFAGLFAICSFNLRLIGVRFYA